MGEIMAKITRAELMRNKRVALYKKIIIYGFFVMTILPVFTSVFLFYKVSKIEKKLDYALSEDGGDYRNYRSSKEALLGNPNADSGVFASSAKTVLSNASVDTNNAKNTENTDGSTQGIEQADAVGSMEENAAQTENTTEGEKATKADEKQAKRVYLTFDDGPSIYTGQILDILAKNDVKATFFVIGRDERYYDYYRRIVDEGHTLGMHSYSHVYQDLYKSVDSFSKEITKLNDLLYEVTGERSTIFRFPGGSSNNVSQLPIQDYIAYLNENNINYYDWNALNGDAVTKDLSPKQLVNNIMHDVENNQDSIVLMHDLQTTHTTVESLQLLIDELKSEGYEILPIDENTPLIQHVSCNSVEE